MINHEYKLKRITMILIWRYNWLLTIVLTLIKSENNLVKYIDIARSQYDHRDNPSVTQVYETDASPEHPSRIRVRLAL